MFIPYNTDAPIYHYPIGTVSLIVANTLAFFAVILGDWSEESLRWWILEYGTLNPVQWVTSNFMHGGLEHLLGNMFFLWAFGLVIEGKLGLGRFLPIYLGIGVLQCAIEQFVMLGAAEGGSLGASAVLFGLMGMALIWAPKNDMNCFIWFFGPRLVSLPITVFCGINVVFQFAIMGLTGFSMSGAVLHMMGFVIGLAVAVVMLKRDWVDCEGWDLFRVMKGEHKPPLLSQRKVVLPDRAKKYSQEFQEHKAQDEQELKLRQLRLQQEREEEAILAQRWLRSHLAEGNARAAYAVFAKQAGADGTRWEPAENDLLALVTAMHKEKLWLESVPAMVQLIRRFPNRATAARLLLAQILLQADHRPKQALKVLAPLEQARLTEKQQVHRAKLIRLANHQIEEGHVELDVYDW